MPVQMISRRCGLAMAGSPRFEPLPIIIPFAGIIDLNQQLNDPRAGERHWRLIRIKTPEE
jgi:hypothetical protein